jgi:ABC-type glycerol-3-phosphate transport system substrate-binding protein
MQPKSRIGAPFFFLLLLAGNGCSSAPRSDAAPESLKLRVACPAGAAADVVRGHCKAWQARNCAEVEVREYGAEGPQESEPDAWVIAPAEIGRWAESGQLLPVPAEFQDKDDAFDWKGLLPLYREHLLLWGHAAYALPVLGEGPLCVYRSDLFKDANLPPPATWRDVEDRAAHFFAKRRVASLPPLPADDDGLEREFYTIAAGYSHRAVTNITGVSPTEAFSFQCDYDSGAPRIDSPGFVHALALMQRLQAYRPQLRASPVDAFRTGVGVFCLADAADVLRMQGARSAVRDKFAIARVPAAEVCFAHAARSGDAPVEGENWMPYLGAGALLGVVPKTCAHAPEAFDLLAELGGRDVSRQVVLSPRVDPPRGGGALRIDHFDRNARWEAFELDASRTAALKAVVLQTLEHRSVANPVYPLRTPDARLRRAVLVGALREALEKPASDPAQALASVAERWRKMTGVHFAREHRLALGFGG